MSSFEALAMGLQEGERTRDEQEEDVAGGLAGAAVNVVATSIGSDSGSLSRDKSE